MLAAVQQLRSSSECVIILHVLIRVICCETHLVFTLAPTPSNTIRTTWQLSVNCPCTEQINQMTGLYVPA